MGGTGNGGLGISMSLGQRMNDPIGRMERLSARGFADVYFRRHLCPKAKAENDPFFIYLPTNVPHRDNNVPVNGSLPTSINLDQAAFYAG